MQKCLIITSVKKNNGLDRYCNDLLGVLEDKIGIEFINFYHEYNFFKNSYINGVFTSLISITKIILGYNSRMIKMKLKKTKYDYIIIPFQWQGYLVPSIKKITDIPILTVVHDFMSYNIYKNSFLHVILRNYLINPSFYSDKIVFISEATKNDFIDLTINFNGKYKVIPNFINTSLFYPISGNKSYLYQKFDFPKTKIFLSVTGQGKHKNNLTFCKLANEFRNFYFVKVGGFEKECLEYISENKLSNIRLMKGLSNDDLRELYNITDIYINTSTKEGFGYPSFEALFCGTKVLTTKSINLNKCTGVYFVSDFYDIKEYTKGIETLIKEDLNFTDQYLYTKKAFQENFLMFLREKI